MASDYGLNFGFRRSDESMRSGTEGRLKVPAAGTFYQGDLVTFDPANPGFIRKAPAGSAIDPGFTGLLIQEEGWDASIYEAGPGDSFTRGRVRNGRLCAIWTGAGLKVWLKNTAAQNRADGRAIPQRQVLEASAVGQPIGGLLGWDGDSYVASAGAGDAVARVTLTNGVDYVEAVLQK
jgi:hypothetical protein